MNNKVALSIAHYPEAPGAGYNGFYEHFESVVWTMLIAQVLKDHGMEAVIAPVDTLECKVAWVNKQKAALALEVHFNGDSDANVKGCETLHYPKSKEGISLARTVHDSYIDTMNTNDRGIKVGYYQMNPDKPIDYFLRETNCPAIITEPEFISQIHSITKHRCKATTDIAIGICKYLEQGDV